MDAGVLEVRRDRVRFTHPLLASAIYADAPEDRRRAVHQARACVLRRRLAAEQGIAQRHREVPVGVVEVAQDPQRI